MSQEILIVDDEQNIVLSLQFLMRQQGYSVRTAEDGEQAIAALNEHLPDLVLLDVMMPRKDGYEVCQTIRQTPQWSQLPVIMLTAKGREVEREKGMAMGANDYITKPFSTSDVVEVVRSYLGEK
ncbi:response regulator [Halorhodospira halochloris]|uniref:Response regulator receiver protein in cluster with DNA polymerase III epsilon subunit n=1 Tax=Halorhodospira halochloris TaxID=1052 RepID=A0A0X8X8R8_HALHR|nr:response regulator [Halorhodospira halochloris]MBK1651349.1 two-component system response regulator [Halorhodospira halochloris]MCG5529863.1 response regulator [Halorhodospira halochloris]MCG5547607.1 response regulator [Halorhodospira halochloris]BAU57636.1 response regulator receiver protein in cluster with DNA polymerase III epsilon subunit [Halorhodospira halochloris]